MHVWWGDKIFEVVAGFEFVFTCLFFDFEKAAAARESEFLETRRNGEANSAIGAREVGDDEVGCQRVELAFDAFYGGVE